MSESWGGGHQSARLQFSAVSGERRAGSSQEPSAADAHERARLRETLVQARNSSPLFDARRTARAIERAYLAMMEQHRARRRAPIVITDEA